MIAQELQLEEAVATQVAEVSETVGTLHVVAAGRLLDVTLGGGQLNGQSSRLKIHTFLDLL